MSSEPTVKRWTAKRKAAVVMDIFKGKTTVAEVARQHDLTVSEGGCGGFLGLVVVHVHAARPKPPRYSSGLWPPKDSLTLFRLYHWI